MDTRKLDKQKVTISLPSAMLDMVREKSIEECMTMSVYIQVALKSYLDQQEVIKLSRLVEK